MGTAIWLIVILVVVIAVGLWAVQRQRSTRLRQRFGEEYDRTVERSGNRRDAEQQLADVAERRDQLTIRPLSAAERQTWLQQWSAVQARFVDAPAEAVTTARELIPALMRDRGYPVEGFEQRATLLATDHPVVVQEYRAAEQSYDRYARSGDTNTEDLRQSLVHYRALFESLVEPDAASDVHPDRPANSPINNPIDNQRGVNR
jgi:hypothetical protein